VRRQACTRSVRSLRRSSGDQYCLMGQWMYRISDAATTALEAGIIVPDVSDLLKAVQLIDALDASESSRLNNDLARFTRGVQNHVNEKTRAKIDREYIGGRHQHANRLLERYR
jgi:hypothetical protein